MTRTVDDEAQIDVAVPSISTPGVHFGDDGAARRLASRVNEYLAGIKRDRPDRFGAFAALPLPDVEGSLEQIAYAFDVLELDGVSVFSNAGGSYLGDARFDPIFAERRQAALQQHVRPNARRQVRLRARWRHDPVRRLALRDRRRDGGHPGAQERGAFADVLPRLHWDTASAFSDPVLHILRSVAGLENVVFRTDYPYPRDEISIGGLRQLQRTAELDEGERRGILGASAARLIPRLAGIVDAY